MQGHFDEYNGPNRLMEAQRKCVPFGHWSIWQRREQYGDRTGPALFSLFFLAGEGVASYQHLYERNGHVPKLCAIIQPGHAFGNNWTNFFNPDAPFWKVVKRGSDTPGFLLIGTFGESPPTDGCKCPFEGYRFLRRTTIRENDRTEYVYNEQGDATRLFIFAVMKTKDSAFKIETRRVRGCSHTIDIFERQT